MTQCTTCPSCGARRLRRVRRNITRTFRGKTYKVPGVQLRECLRCGEEIYGAVAVRKIQAHSPAFPSVKVG